MMAEMYDPSNPAHIGPQITARPGTKRHLAQTIARAKFFAINHSSAKANLRRAEAALAAHMTKMLTNLPASGSA
jgi:hypothetical protein